MSLTAEYLYSVVDYDPATGVFRWKRRDDAPENWNARFAGGVAGTLSDHGYNKVMIKGRWYRAARLAWLYMTGEWPAHQVDHRNLRRNDDRWDNLRDVTHSQNQSNTSKRKDNTSGMRGVDFRNGKWRARISHDGSRIYLGRFDVFEDAVAAFTKAATELRGDYVRV